VATYENLKVEHDGGVRRIALDRPEALNALSIPLIEELVDAAEEAADDNSVRCILLTAEGRAFCAGGDLKAMAEPESDFVARGVPLGRRLIETLLWAPKPVVTAVNGAAAGAGACLAAVGDVIVMAESAFLEFSFVKVGLVPDFGGLYLLSRLVSGLKARELVMSGRRVPAHEAAEIGLATQVVPDGDLDKAAREIGQEMAHGPTLALAQIRQILNSGAVSSAEALFTAEDGAQRFLSKSHDHAEGISAFFGKRPPAFTGR